MPVIQPLLGADGYVNAYQGKLIIRTDEAEFARIGDLLERLPQQTQNVTIALRRNRRGRQRGGDVRIRRHGVTIDGGDARYTSQQVYTVNTLAGHPVHIAQGNLIALTAGYYPLLMQLQRGLWATPTLTAAGRVRLSVYQRFDESGARGRVRTESSATTVMLTPGQWQSLSSIVVRTQTDSAGLAGAGTPSRRMDLPLEVKVELH